MICRTPPSFHLIIDEKLAKELESSSRIIGELECEQKSLLQDINSGTELPCQAALQHLITPLDYLSQKGIWRQVHAQFNYSHVITTIVRACSTPFGEPFSPSIRGLSSLILHALVKAPR